MRIFLALAIASVSLAPVQAAETLETGPIPGWVKSVPVPPSTVKPQGNVTYLLQDQQLDFAPDQVSDYTETVFRIENAEGLSSGNISLAWQPGIERLIVHRLTIRRGDKLIDVLGSGQKFEILRRESNLESAMLDGELTANIQPEGLQVGDVIDLAATTISSDPTLRGHVEALTDASYSVPVQRQHFSAQWPASLRMKLRQTSGLPLLGPRREGDLLKTGFTVDGLQPATVPKGAPLRYRRPRTIEFSDFPSWSNLAGLFAPLYDKAAALPASGPLHDEIVRIRTATPDPKARAEAALALVEGRIRYVALLMGSGNFVPADAATTWDRRFGDCKAKSALLVGILRALDIPAEPVIVNSDSGDGLDERLPMAGLFNHVIVRATIGGKTYWLDSTRTGDRRLDQLRTPDYGWGLPLVAGASLVRMQPEQLVLPHRESILRIDASRGTDVPAPAHAEMLFRGDDAYGMSVGAADMTADERDRRLREYWKKRYPFIEVTAVGQSYDADKREQRFTMEGTATMDWRGGVYWLTDSDLGYSKTDFEREAGENRDAPYSVAFPYYIRAVETIVLPRGAVPDDADVDVTAGGAQYRRKGVLTGNVFTVETSARSLAPEFPSREAPAAQKTIRELADRSIALRLGSSGYASAATSGQAPKTVDDYLARGSELLDRSDWDGALAAFDAAVRLDPRDPYALAARGITQTWRGNYEAAARDLNNAAVLDPDNPYVLRGRGYLAQTQERYADALRFYSRSLEKQPEDGLVRGWRAYIYRKLQNYEAALDDARAATKSSPDWTDMYVLRASIYHQLGQPEKVLAEARAIVAANPDDGLAHGEAAAIYDRLGKRDEAMREIDRAIAIDPSASFYLSRMDLRGWSDIAGQQGDVEAALRLDPKNQEALRAKAQLQRRTGNLQGAIATLSSALRQAPNSADLLSLRRQLHYLADRKQDAERDFAAARAAARDAADFNSLCWNKAVAGIDLASALTDCDTAVADTPDNAAMLDSRAFVLLKLGRLDEAIATYDRALARNSDLAESYLGRAVAWSRKGDKRKAAADRAAAIALDPEIVDSYRDYGLSFGNDGTAEATPSGLPTSP
jgi:tetratricopeptide (TPR) repeat protein